MIICKLFEIIKSYIIILSVDCNTHLNTLSKKQKNFKCYRYRRKQRGAGHQVGEKCSFLGRQKFLAGGSNIWPGSSTIFFESKTKKLCNFKGGQFGIFEKHGCPSFETNHPIKRTFIWHVRIKTSICCLQ